MREATTRRALWQERVMLVLLTVCVLVSVATTLAIVVALTVEAVGFFRVVPLWRFLTEREWTPLFATKKFGILPLVCGTMLTAGIAMLLAVPLALLIAIYLAEYASKRRRQRLKPIVELLAGTLNCHQLQSLTILLVIGKSQKAEGIGVTSDPLHDDIVIIAGIVVTPTGSLLPDDGCREEVVSAVRRRRSVKAEGGDWENLCAPATNSSPPLGQRAPKCV